MTQKNGYYKFNSGRLIEIKDGKFRYLNDFYGPSILQGIWYSTVHTKLMDNHLTQVSKEEAFLELI